MSQSNPKTLNKQLPRPDLDTYRKLDKTPVVLLLSDIRSGLNIGSIFRTSDAFLVKKIYLSGICAVPPNKEILKTALGATESVAWEYVQDVKELISRYRSDGWTAIALEQTVGSVRLSDFKASAEGKYLVIAGNEVDGVAQELVDQCDLSVEIPQHGTKHSLNVAVAAGIMLWELYRTFSDSAISESKAATPPGSHAP